MTRIVATILMAGLLAACVRTNVTSFTDPAYRDRNLSGSTVLVWAADNLTLEERMTVEEAAVQALAGKGLTVSRGLELFPPTREFTPEDRVSVVGEKGFDFVLTLDLLDLGSSTAYVPPVYYPGTASGKVTTYGNTSTFTIKESPGYTTGGYTVQKPTASFFATLFESQTAADETVTLQQVWTADLTTGGGVQHSYTDLAKAAMLQAVARLSEDGLLP